MATLQERLQMKRVPIDKWSIKEQLCLSSAVSRSGDQNWMSVSRALKPFAEPNRPPDWFSQKNCAAQYGLLLENVETPKRKKRISGSTSDSGLETPQDIILKKLTEARKTELKKKMEDEKREYLKIQKEMEMIGNGTATDEMIEKWNKEIEEEEKQKAQDAIAHSQWLKQREERKLEVERAFRPIPKLTPPITQKRKVSESVDTVSNVDSSEETTTPTPEASKPALSPLLTSLLKTPSHVPSTASSILHSAITSQRGTSPTIASLLNTTTTVPVSPSLQQLVTTAISQEPNTTNSTTNNTSENNNNDQTEVSVENSTTIKAEQDKITEELVSENKNPVIPELISSEIKQEPLTPDPSTSTIPQSSKDDTNKPPDLPDETIKTETPENTSTENQPQEQLDVYDFDTLSKTSSDETTSKDRNVDTPIETETESSNDKKPSDIETASESNQEIESKKETPSPQDDATSKNNTGSVEIVEVKTTDEEDSDKEMNKKVSEIKRDIQDKKDKPKESNVQEPKSLIYAPSEKEKEETKQNSPKKDFSPIKKETPKKDTTVYDEYDFDDLKKPEEKPDPKLLLVPTIDLDASEVTRKSTITPELPETLYDDMSIEVTKLEKTGKAKRDYSRTKKKEEKDIDILLTVESVTGSLEENDNLEETESEKDLHDSDKKSENEKVLKLKDADRSNSPWTEEEAEVLPRTRRRLSATPATPSDSIPNSPASGIGIFDDDREYRTWKKSVMLVYNRLVTHKCASLFLKPITDEQAPGYHSTVYRAMDLQTIRKNIENGAIRTTPEFQRDVLLMFNNAIMYNQKNEMVYQMAQQMQQEGLQQIQILLQAQTQVEMPARRETRTSESGFKRKRGQEEIITKNKKRRDE